MLSVRALLAVFAIAFVMVAALAFPMRLALSLAGLDNSSAVSVRTVHGTVWNGALDGAQLGARAIGKVETGLSVLPLLKGALSAPVAWQGPAGSGQAKVTHKAGDTEVDGIYARIPINTGAMAGAVDLSSGRIILSSGRCSEAVGDLSGMVGGLPVSGTLICQGGEVYAQLQLPGNGSAEIPVFQVNTP